MNRAAEIVKQLMQETNINGKTMAKMNNMSKQSFSQFMHRPEYFNSNTFMDFVESTGYEVTVEYTGCRKASPEFIEILMQEKEPTGIYYAEENGMYKLVDNRTGEPKVILFPDKQMMYQWTKLVSKNPEK